MQRRQTTACIGCVLLGLSLAATANDALPRVAVVIEPPQETLLGPDPFERRSRNFLSDILLLEPLVATVGLVTIIESSSALNYFSSEDWLRRASAQGSGERFDFREAIASRIESLDDAGTWTIVEHDFVRLPAAKRVGATRIFDDDIADHALFLEFTWFMSPQLNRVRIYVRSYLYRHAPERTRPDRLRETTYSLVSHSQGDPFRPWRPGEKEALISSVHAEYDSKLERFPHNGKAYAKDRKAALKAIESRDTVLPEIAICEAWPADELVRTLRDSTDVMFDAIARDLQSFDERPMDKADRVELDVMDIDGDPDTVDGWLVTSLANYDVYRTAAGDVYVLPRK